MLQEEDYLTFQLYTASLSPQVKRMRLMSWILTTIAFLCMAYLFYYSDKTFLMGYFLVCACLSALLYPFYSRWRYKRHYLKHIQNTYQHKFGTDSELSFTDEAIINKDVSGEVKFNISEIEAIHEIQDYYFIKSKSGLSLIVSKIKSRNIETIKTHIEKLVNERHIPHVVNLNWKWH